MTVCLIGVLKQYLKRNAFLCCATQWRLATKPQTEKGAQNSFLIAYFSSTLCWLWEKSPDIWQKVSVVKKHVFLESPAPWARRRSFNRRAAGREKDVVEAKLCKVTSVADVIWTGLTLTDCVPSIFLNLRKSMANVGVLFMLFSVGNKVPKVDKILCPTPRGRL